MLVVSDTSDGIPIGQRPSLARCFVEVSDFTMTSFSCLLIEIDTAKMAEQSWLQSLVPTGNNSILRWTRWSVCKDGVRNGPNPL